MTVDELISGYASDLNDAEPGHENTIWTREDLLRYVNEGLCLIAALRPDEFVKIVVAKVTPMVEEVTVCDCNKIRRVLGQCNENGVVTRQLNYKSVNSRLVWTGKNCVTNGKYLYEYSIGGKNTVFVSPPVGYGVNAWIKVECVGTATPLVAGGEVSGMACEYLAVLAQYVLYRAKSRDEMSAALRAAGADHFAAFEKLTNALRAAYEATQPKVSG